jgi:hypothetical protein
MIWEVRIVGDRNQGVWATCLIQCLNVIPMIFFETTVRQLLSLYLRFYKVTMLESTNATDEGRMRMYV